MMEKVWVNINLTGSYRRGKNEMGFLKKTKVNRHNELCNSFPRIAIRSLDLHNLFSRFLDLHNSFFRIAF